MDGSGRKRACVLDVINKSEDASGDKQQSEAAGIGQTTRQGHLIEPFERLLTSLDQLVESGAAGSPIPGERACVEDTGRSLFSFFQALLPTASGDALEDLTYSVALLLLGEAIEANRVVADATHFHAAGTNS